ncbi:hypothetical protein MUP59_02670 [Candidatus Bathyarchaeota archaeon]|nr:hypothetical protein [Candidatus Bathyarchaeota archaeon]
MATFTWEVYSNTPGWHDTAGNTVVFSGSPTDITTPVTVGEWNSGTHIGNGDPGADQCGTNHVCNVKYISGTQFDSGGGTETLNDTNLTATECTIRCKFADASAVATSSARFYTFDGSTATAEAIGVHAYAFERGVGATAWVQVNDDSGNIGGDNGGERLALSDQSAATEHYFYLAVTAQPESVGAKTQFDFGLALTYS